MTTPHLENDLRASIRTIPDYPKPGIMFRDITTLLGDARAFRRAVDELVQPWAGSKIDKVAGIEARGFILGGAVAHQLSAGFVPIRKKGKLPHETRAHRLLARIWPRRDGDARRRDREGERVILVDDLIATGGTAEAAVKLLRHSAPTCSPPASSSICRTSAARQAAQARRAGAHADCVRGALIPERVTSRSGACACRRARAVGPTGLCGGAARPSWPCGAGRNGLSLPSGVLHGPPAGSSAVLRRALPPLLLPSGASSCSWSSGASSDSGPGSCPPAIFTSAVYPLVDRGMRGEDVGEIRARIVDAHLHHGGIGARRVRRGLRSCAAP